MSVLARTLATATLLALVPLATVTASSSAGERRVKPAVSVAASSHPVEGETVHFRGRTDRRATGARAVLKKKVRGTWTAVDRGRVRKSGRFALDDTARSGSVTYRVRVSKTARTRAASSKVVVDARSSADIDVVQLILDDTNTYRAQHDLPPLLLMDELTTVAQDWSDHMAESDDFRHNPDYTSQYPPGWTGAAENIAAGYEPDQVVDGWYDSPGHRANLLGEFTHLGIGYATSDTARYGTYFTQNFADY